MLKLFCVLIFASLTAVNGDYIKNSEAYRIVKSEEGGYMKLVEKAYNNKSFSKVELQKALNTTNFHPMSDVLRIIALDEVRQDKELDKYLKNAMIDVAQIRKDKTIMFVFCDVLLRNGEYDKILKIIDRDAIPKMSKKDKRKAYYYVGMAKYLKKPSADFSSEFMIIKYKFPITQKIFTESKKAKQ